MLLCNPTKVQPPALPLLPIANWVASSAGAHAQGGRTSDVVLIRLASACLSSGTTLYGTGTILHDGAPGRRRRRMRRDTTGNTKTTPPATRTAALSFKRSGVLNKFVEHCVFILNRFHLVRYRFLFLRIFSGIPPQICILPRPPGY